MRYTPGFPAELTATFTDLAGNLIDPDVIEVDLSSPNGSVVSGSTDVERISLGFYKFTYDLPEDAPLGLWRIDWTVEEEGRQATAGEVFEVEEPGVVIGPGGYSEREQLRARLFEEKTDPEGNGSETFFTDATLDDMIVMFGGSLDAATLEGWRRKAARYQRLIDIDESGSNRKLSQKFRQAVVMVQMWNGVIGDASEARSAALRGRVVGRPVNLRTYDTQPVLTPFSGYTDHIRVYPTHRFVYPAILG